MIAEIATDWEEAPVFEPEAQDYEEASRLREAESAPQVYELLDKRRIVLTEPPPRPVPVFKLAGQRISTAGNLTVIAAQAKHGKSAAVGAMLAAIFAEEDDAGDYLGFEALPPEGRAVVFFDTEQSRFDAWQLVSRAMKRASMDRHPANFRPYAILDLCVPDRLQVIDAELRRAASECGAIHAVFIDGVGDLCRSVNDEAEANELVGRLVAYAVLYECPIVCVIHENPAAQKMAGKTRGHLGSHLERKAESNLRVKKDSNGVSVIFSEICRGASIPESIAPRFKFSDEAGMHVSCESVNDAKKAAEREDMVEDVREIFNAPGAIVGLSWDELHSRIETVCGLKRAGARKRFNKLRDAGLIKKNAAGLWTR
jgi:hypothetical protein